MAAVVDEGIGNITDALVQSGNTNSVLFLSGDNGGQIRAGGSNYPLRGTLVVKHGLLPVTLASVTAHLGSDKYGWQIKLVYFNKSAVLSSRLQGLAMGRRL